MINLGPHLGPQLELRSRDERKLIHVDFHKIFQIVQNSKYDRAPNRAPNWSSLKNLKKEILRILWNQKWSQCDEQKSKKPNLKCPSKNFQKTWGHMEFGALEIVRNHRKYHIFKHEYLLQVQITTMWDTILIFCSSEKWHDIVFKKINLGPHLGPQN